MLPHPNRLNKELLSLVLRSGHVISSPPLVARIIPRKPSGPTQIALVISAKKVKKAVTRNFIKRRARAILIKLRQQLKPNFRAVVFLDPTWSTVSFVECEKQLVFLLQKAKMLNT